MALLFAQLMAFHRGDFQILFFFVLLIVAQSPDSNPFVILNVYSRLVIIFLNFYITMLPVPSKTMYRTVSNLDIESYRVL
jgi:hypothetical protein